MYAEKAASETQFVSLSSTHSGQKWQRLRPSFIGNETIRFYTAMPYNVEYISEYENESFGNIKQYISRLLFLTVVNYGKQKKDHGM